jgi:hypothetical protein
MTAATPCTICGKADRWDDHGTWRCKVCWSREMLGGDFTVLATRAVTNEQTLPCPEHGRESLRIDRLNWVVCEAPDCLWSAPLPGAVKKGQPQIRRAAKTPAQGACPGCGDTTTPVAGEPFDDGSVLYRCAGCHKPRYTRAEDVSTAALPAA